MAIVVDLEFPAFIGQALASGTSHREQRRCPSNGLPGVFLDLREAGETCSKHRVARLMRENDLRALHGYRTRRWSVSKPAVLIPELPQLQWTVS